MTRAAEIQGAPRAHLRVPEEWPYGEVDDTIPAQYARIFAQRLGAAIGDRSFRSVSRAAGVSHRTIAHLVRGESWPDLITIAKLEFALGAVLWPGPELLLDDLRRLRRESDALRGIRQPRRRPRPRSEHGYHAEGSP